jgi:sensitive to high expression protein 9
MSATRAAARDAKTAFETAVQQRSASQKEVNDLLQRKAFWVDADVGRFTELVRQDHALEQAEARARQAVQDAEAAVEREFTAFMRAILDRYHEEQVWSDKIRSVSTYGSLAVVAANLFVFLLAILVVEPWKRRRLAQTFESKVDELEREHLAVTTTAVERLETRMAEQDEILAQVLAATTAATKPASEEELEEFLALVQQKSPESELVDTVSESFWPFSRHETRKIFWALNLAVALAGAAVAALTILDG